MTTATFVARPSQLGSSTRPTNLDTIRLRVLPPAPAQWSSGLVWPGLAHLVSTEDGRARIVEFEGQPALVGVCGAALGADPTLLPELLARGSICCTRCDRAYRDLRCTTERGDHR